VLQTSDNGGLVAVGDSVSRVGAAGAPASMQPRALSRALPLAVVATALVAVVCWAWVRQVRRRADPASPQPDRTGGEGGGGAAAAGFAARCSSRAGPSPAAGSAPSRRGGNGNGRLRTMNGQPSMPHSGSLDSILDGSCGTWVSLRSVISYEPSFLRILDGGGSDDSLRRDALDSRFRQSSTRTRSTRYAFLLRRPQFECLGTLRLPWQ
jgi:hypothetical protein